ncbi:hypothetical protein G6F17_009177 [Rhizopus arrhizus]|nr:hypothetical protein G6F21_008385 [Rhizopus arrhizus]KAG0851230.1 hypothetical protein G6F17_009177 [Rhizopus arrhizus]
MFAIPKKKNGGSRPVFNLKKLNKYIQAPHFKMETPVRCLPSHPHSCGLQTISSVELERQDLSILYHLFRPVSRPMDVNQTHQNYSQMSTDTTYSTECLPRRLDHHLQHGSSGNSTHAVSGPETRIVRLDNSLQRISSETSAINRTPRLLIGYHHNDSTSARKETEGFTSKHSTDFEESFTITPHHSQPHHENSSSNFCINAGKIVRPTLVAHEKSDRAYMVEEQHLSLERQEYITSNTSEDGIHNTTADYESRSGYLHCSTTLSVSKRRRSICRSDYEITSKIRVLASRSGQLVCRRIYNPLEPIPKPIPKSAMEIDQSMSPEDHSGEASTRHDDHILVAQRDLVPNNPVSEHQFTFTAPPVGDCLSVTNRDLANDQQYLETRHLELIRSKYQQFDLNENAQAILINHRIQDSSANRSYKP